MTYLSTEGIVRARPPSEIGTHLRVLIDDTFWSVCRRLQGKRGPVVEVWPGVGAWSPSALLDNGVGTRWYELDDGPDLLVPVVNQ